MRHGYLLGYQHITSLCFLLPVFASVSPPILPGAQRYWPRAPAEFRGTVCNRFFACLAAIHENLRKTVSYREFLSFLALHANEEIFGILRDNNNQPDDMSTVKLLLDEQILLI